MRLATRHRGTTASLPDSGWLPSNPIATDLLHIATIGIEIGGTYLVSKSIDRSAFIVQAGRIRMRQGNSAVGQIFVIPPQKCSSGSTPERFNYNKRFISRPWHGRCSKYESDVNGTVVFLLHGYCS